MSGIISHGMIRSAFTFDPDAVSSETGIDCSADSVTQQSFKDECDINILLAKFAVTGQLPDNVRVPQFVDFEDTFDFQSSMNVLRAAEEAFASMPANVRDRFANDPGRLVEFANNPDNYDEAVRLGLAIKRPVQGLPDPIKALPEPLGDLESVRPGAPAPDSSQA
nr:MAG: internal scaffolding protein [Microvirus sp.]